MRGLAIFPALAGLLMSACTFANVPRSGSFAQVTSGRKYWTSDNTPVAGQNFEYSFDDIGNRKYSGSGGGLISARTVTDLHEAKAEVARSRSSAVGATAGARGTIAGEINLKTTVGFDVSRDEHSAQFTRPIQTSRPYYQQVLRSCNILPAP